MIPTGAVPADAEFNESEQPSRTYMLDFARGRVSGMVDELEAVKQAVYKALSTDRFFHFIYTTNYGSEVQINSAETELERWVNEALLQDDRITAIENYQVTVNGDSALMEFTVVSTLGRFSVSQEVQ
ncbi:DUF2634 domain-containing protein [Paenibacillus pinihumi]|uniref:DUF2634 domain-containing protein n=1 Tax=Paenibacillus pinihumi TaxID=669462 RepID=UPI00040D5D19|nr:DUF2634 domain-containing protein [Paenibacillus pinihumi]